MEEKELKLFEVEGLEKCGLIYRDSSSSFLYVCYHCGSSFDNIHATLQHIEAHFEETGIEEIETGIEEIETGIEEIETITSEPGCNTSLQVDSQSEPEIVVFKNEQMDFDITENVEYLDEPESDPISAPAEQIEFRCKTCDANFSTKFLLRVHLLRSHFQEDTLECKECSSKFKYNLNFEKHLKQHMKRDEVSWSCTGDGIQKPQHVDWSNYGPVAHDNGTELPIQNKSIDPSNEFLPKFYKCHKCSEAFTELNDLKNHFDYHPTNEMLEINRCKRCESYFPTDFDLRLHVLADHFFTKKFKCSTCLVEFQQRNKSQLKDHLELHLSSSTVAWKNICEGIFTEGLNLTIFEDKMMIGEELPCLQCKEKFYLKSNLRTHGKRMHSELQELHCGYGQCESVFTRKKHYFAHQLEHERTGAGIMEREMSILVERLNLHIDEHFVLEEGLSKPYKCLRCSNCFSRRYDIRRHARERHVYKTLPQPHNMPKKRKKVVELTCDTCGRVCNKAWMKKHLMTHTDIKDYECSHCNKKFRNKSDKIIHERLHTGEKPFQCHECGKRFPSSALLTAHKKRHDSTTYPCPTCGRVFNEPSGYRRHIQIHRKDKIFQCTVCSQSFNTRVYLTRHMFKHSEKTFQCKFCEEKFNTANGRKQHERCKHNYDPGM